MTTIPAPQPAPTKNRAIEKLKTFIRKERDARQVRKALAVKLIYQDYGYETITGLLEVSLGALSKWKQAYERDGLAGFRPQHKGRQSDLTPSERDRPWSTWSTWLRPRGIVSPLKILLTWQAWGDRSSCWLARQRSVELGYGGRVGLHSLRRTEAFYHLNNMADYGPDPDKDGLVYFEYPALQR